MSEWQARWALVAAGTVGIAVVPAVAPAVADAGWKSGGICWKSPSWLVGRREILIRLLRKARGCSESGGGRVRDGVRGGCRCLSVVADGERTVVVLIACRFRWIKMPAYLKGVLRNKCLSATITGLELEVSKVVLHGADMGEATTERFR